MNRLKCNHYLLHNSSTKIHVLVYNEQLVRVCYGEEIGVSITDAVVMDFEARPCMTSKKLIELQYFDISLNNEGFVQITSKNGTMISEDLLVKYNCKAEDFEYQEQEYEVVNRDMDKIYAYEIKRKLKKDAGYYGIGEKYGFINYLGRNTENWNTDVLGVSPIHTSAQQAYHTSIPFYMEVTGQYAYGIFHDTSFRNYFDFGKYHNAITMRADGGEIDYYFIYGPSVSEVVKVYTDLTGKAPLPRKDFLGYQQSRWSYTTADSVLKIARTFREKEIPADVIYLDIDYMQDYKVFTWNSERFAEFKDMIIQLEKMHFKLVVIIDPGIKKEIGYHAYDSGINHDCFIKDSSGEVYIGKVWPGDSAFPDFLQQKVRLWWKKLHEDLLDDGVKGLWNDMNEIADMSTESKTVPEDAYHRLDDGTFVTQKEVHNIYGHYHARASYEAMLGRGIRPFVLTRAASAGTQRYSAIWTGDNTSIWEHLEMSIPMLMNLGLSGYAYSGADIGGFIGDGEAELFQRWMQLGVFYPLCRNHSCVNSLHQEPWAFDLATERIVTKFIKYRYSLISYLYQLFWEHNQTGAPIMRPLFYHYQEDCRTYNINDEFLFGDNMLVAPITRPGTFERLVYLPKGDWFHESTKTWYKGGKSYVISAESEEIPIFIRGASLVIRDFPMEYINPSIEKLQVHIYHGDDFEKLLYFDDGISYNHENGNYSIVKITLISNVVSIDILKNDFPIPEIQLVEYKNEVYIAEH